MKAISIALCAKTKFNSVVQFHRCRDSARLSSCFWSSFRLLSTCECQITRSWRCFRCVCDGKGVAAADSWHHRFRFCCIFDSVLFFSFVCCCLRAQRFRQGVSRRDVRRIVSQCAHPHFAMDGPSRPSLNPQLCLCLRLSRWLLLCGVWPLRLCCVSWSSVCSRGKIRLHKINKREVALMFFAIKSVFISP
jgi:hypothetical protein